MENKTKKNILWILLIIIFIPFIYFLNWLTTNPDPYVEMINSHFEGVITKKYRQRTTHFIINTKDRKNIDNDVPSLELEELSVIGDSLVKIKDRNCCILIKGKIEIIIPYIAIPDDIIERSEYLQKANKDKCE